MKTGREVHILVVEDDLEMRNLLEKILSKGGYRISAASNGFEALKRIGEEPVDLVITDMLMPEMGGMRLLEEIKGAHPEKKVIMITAFGDWGSYSHAMDLGVFEFISKPLKMTELLEAVERALEARIP
ncbi:MAG: response regulator [candidate division NC10 bacterium]|nr:response regulator [candidate division NC10 bacterium]